MACELSILAYRKLEDVFHKFCLFYGYTPQQSLCVTNTQGDKSTRFVGSVTNVFKPFYGSNYLSSGRFFLAQDCFKTFNLKKGDIRRCSYYPAFGLHTSATEVTTALRDLYALLVDGFGISDASIETHVSSCDSDIIELLHRTTVNFPKLRVEVDRLDLLRYRHIFGDESITGRNIAIFLDDATGRRKRIFIATYIIIAVSGCDTYCEITVKPMAIAQYMTGSEREFELYPMPKHIERLPTTLQPAFHDSLIACCLLFRAGMQPSNKNNQTRLFREYAKRLTGFSDYAHESNAFIELISEYEDCIFSNKKLCLKDLKALNSLFNP